MPVPEGMNPMMELTFVVDKDFYRRNKTIQDFKQMAESPQRSLVTTNGSLMLVPSTCLPVIYLVQISQSQHHGGQSQHQVWNPWTIEGGSVTIFFPCSFLVIIVPLQLSIFPLNFHLFHMHSIAVHTQPHPQSCCLHIASCIVLNTATFLSI